MFARSKVDEPSASKKLISPLLLLCCEVLAHFPHQWNSTVAMTGAEETTLRWGTFHSARSLPTGFRLMSICVRSLVLALCLCCPFTTTYAQDSLSTSSGSATASSEREQLLEEGILLERQRRWADAIQHYESATKLFATDAKLSRRLSITRLHYDVVRRTNDSGLNRVISAVPVDDVLDLYSEVLARLETSYVDEVSMHAVVRSGTAYLEVALTEPGFNDLFLRGQSSSNIDRFRNEIHKHTLSGRINSRHDARRVVASAARLAQQQLGIRPSATVMQFVFGAVGLLDPYSSFLSSTELNEVESQIEGNFVGLGVALKPHQAPLKILNVIPGGPALEAGLVAGDEILQIDTVNCEEVGAERSADMLRGVENSQVNLVVFRPSTRETFERRVVRRRVEVPSVEDVRIEDEAAGVAYLKISSFQKTTAAELDAALWSLHGQGMQSLIIDLRGNPGGWLDASVAAADRFVAAGGIVSTRGKNGIENQNYTASRGGTWQVPLVVLIDDESASASEIFAGAIRDNNRGELVGQTTYGKGSVQGLFHTRSLGCGIRLTVSKFYSPSGRAISKQGVQPTIAVQDAAETRMVAKLPATDTRVSAPKDRVLPVAVEQAKKQRLTARITRS